jgi:hypothetical protein
MTAKCRVQKRGECSGKVLLEGGVAEHRAADAASTADLSAVRIEDLTRRILEKTAHGGLMGCGERPGGLLRGTFGPQSVIAPTKPG